MNNREPNHQEEVKQMLVTVIRLQRGGVAESCVTGKHSFTYSVWDSPAMLVDRKADRDALQMTRTQVGGWGSARCARGVPTFRGPTGNHKCAAGKIQNREVLARNQAAQASSGTNWLPQAKHVGLLACLMVRANLINHC